MKKNLIMAVAALMATMSAMAQLERTAEFHEKYTLSQAVVLSRHSIRAPIVPPESILSKVTSHKWYDWSSATGELSLRGGVLETEMGQFFRKWLVSEGLMTENELPAEGTMRFYANSKQRTLATAQYFSSGMLPVANVPIEHHYNLGETDPVFASVLTAMSDSYRERALKQIADLFGDGSIAGIGQKVASNLRLLEEVIDMDQSFFCQRGIMCSFDENTTQFTLNQGEEPALVQGGWVAAHPVSDALLMQYYEESDEVKAAFGHTLTFEDWQRIAAIKDWAMTVVYTAPLIAVNIAHPLLQEILSELQLEGRKFTYLCGHDTNLVSVLAALSVEDYTLPGSVEADTPIGSKIVMEKWLGQDGKDYMGINLCYQSVEQLRQMPLLSMQNPPMVCPLHFEGLTANADGLYLLSDFEQLLGERIAQYDSLPTAVQSVNSAQSNVSHGYRIDGTPATKASRGIVIQDSQKYIMR